MIAEDTLSLDSNTLVYIVDTQAGERHEIAKDFVQRLRPEKCVVTVQALAETYRVVTKKGLASHDVALNYILGWISVFEVISVEQDAMLDAIAAVKRHKMSFWDAMIWATVRKAGCSALITEDMNHGQEIDGVKIISLFSPEAGALLAPYLKDSGEIVASRGNGDSRF